MSMKNSNGTIGNRTRELPACSVVPQPTAPPTVRPLSASNSLQITWPNCIKFLLADLEYLRSSHSNFRLVWFTLAAVLRGGISGLKPVVVQESFNVQLFLMSSMENATHRRNLIIIYIYVLWHILMKYRSLWTFFHSFHSPLKASSTSVNRVRSLNVDSVNISTGLCSTLSDAFKFHSTCSPLTSRIICLTVAGKAVAFCACSKMSNPKFLKWKGALNIQLYCLKLMKFLKSKLTAADTRLQT